MFYSSPVISKLLFIYGSSYRPDVSFFSPLYTLHYKIRFFFNSYQGSKSSTKQFIWKTWSLTKNKLRYNLQLKTDSVKDFITDISSKVLKVCWKKGPITFQIFNEISNRDLKLYQKQAPSLPFIVNLSCLYEWPQGLLKADSIMDSVTNIYSKGLKRY